ncbi:MAG: DUF362 domain-containing protein [Chitinispirillaceae bacterium]|nr:DUF362 domain-containing protein [Chitinispirillaceae bacterium]
MRRRDFIKTAAMAGTAVSVQPLIHGSSRAGTAKSRVVIANDPQCFTNNAAVPARVQDMVDYCIMTLTGQSTRAAAYEALFPEPVTSGTKIVIKYNSWFNLTNTPSYAKVYNALRSGLTSMLNGTFPEANITASDRSGTAASGNPQFTIGSTTYRIQNVIMDCDYFINLAACWAMNNSQYPCGVTMTEKNMMGALSPLGSLSTFHSYFTNSNTPALAILNSQPVFRQKQVLALLDGIAIRTDSGPGGAPNKTAFSVIASKDMVAADYQGLLILKENGLSSDKEESARTVFDLSAQAPYNVGVSDPNDMEVVNIAPPWDTRVTWGGKGIERMGVRVRLGRRNNRSYVIFGIDDRAAGPYELSIFTMSGVLIWTSPTLEWNGETSGGTTASPGPYLFAVKAGRKVVRGHIVVQG